MNSAGNVYNMRYCYKGNRFRGNLVKPWNDKRYLFPRIRLKGDTANVFMLWFLHYITMNEAYGEWDGQGYRLLKACWRVKNNNYSVEDYRLKDFSLMQWRSPSIWDIMQQGTEEYRWWINYTDKLLQSSRFNERLIKKVITFTKSNRLRTRNQIVRFYGRIFGRSRSEIENAI